VVPHKWPYIRHLRDGLQERDQLKATDLSADRTAPRGRLALM
jgi:hypothetical protein